MTFNKLQNTDCLFRYGNYTSDEIFFLQGQGQWPPNHGLCLHAPNGTNTLAPGAAFPFPLNSDMLYKNVMIADTGSDAPIAMAVTNNPSGSTSIAAGAILADGTFWAVTSSTSAANMASIGRTTTPTTWAQTGTATNWTKISMGNQFTVLINSLGEMWSCGVNTSGRTGLNTTSGNTTVLQQIGTANNWVDVWCSFDFAYAVNSLGELWSWGNNASYNTGLGTNTGTTNVPTRVGSATDWLGAKGYPYNAMCLVKSNGTLWIAGTQTTGGRFGNGAGTGSLTTPTQIGTATDWANAWMTANNLYAIKTDGTLYGAGGSTNYALGNYAGINTSTTAGNPTLIPLSAENNWKTVIPCVNHFVGIDTDNFLYHAGTTVQNSPDGQAVQSITKLSIVPTNTTGQGIGLLGFAWAY